MLHWDCRIPGKTNTIWEGGVYPLELRFTNDYPSSPPTAKVRQLQLHLHILQQVSDQKNLTYKTWIPSLPSLTLSLLGYQFPKGFFHPNIYESGTVSPAQADLRLCHPVNMPVPAQPRYLRAVALSEMYHRSA